MIDASDPRVTLIGHPHAAWLVNYADLMTELVCFFIVLYALSASLNKDVQQAKKDVEEKMKQEQVQGQVKVDKDGMKITLEEKGENVFFESGSASPLSPPASPLYGNSRQNRSRLFRAYLHCLTKDYGRLLMGVRQAMLRSGVDRPDLARALAKSRMLFALALCRIQYRLLLHEAGIGKVDISPLVEAIEVLRTQVNVLAPPRFAAYSATI